MRRILLISRHAPYGSSMAREALEAGLAAAVYDQALSLLFMDDGVFQLLAGQEAEAIDQKSLERSLSALPLYGIEPLYVCRDSLQARGLTAEDLLSASIEPLGKPEIQRLIANQEQLLSF